MEKVSLFISNWIWQLTRCGMAYYRHVEGSNKRDRVPPLIASTQLHSTHKLHFMGTT